MRPCLRTLASVAVVVAISPLVQARAAEPTKPGVVTSQSASTTIPVAAVMPGMEVWGAWMSLPAGKIAAVPKFGGEWMHLEIGLSGTEIRSDTMPSHCQAIRVGGASVAAAEGGTRMGPGDGFACASYQREAHREENRGSEAYTYAVLNVGGPWSSEMGGLRDGYEEVGGATRLVGVEASVFAEVAKEIQVAGAITLTIRQTILAPGARTVMVDRHPTLRMVTKGQLEWGALPLDADSQAEPKTMFTKEQFGQLVWGERAQNRKIVLANKSPEPAEVLEWVVSPGAAP